MAARLPLCGTPANPDLARWLGPILAASATDRDDVVQPENILELES
jgi:hypothetical protein